MHRAFLPATLMIAVVATTVTATAFAFQGAEPSPGVGREMEQLDQHYEDPDDLMARELAKMERISLVEARRRLALQNEASVLNGKLRAACGERFAGIMIDRTPTFLVKLYFVEVDLTRVREELPALGASANLLRVIKLERAAETEAEMRATADRMTQQLQSQGIEGSVAWSVPMGGYKILTPQPEKASRAVRMGYVHGGKIIEIERFDGIRVLAR